MYMSTRLPIGGILLAFEDVGLGRSCRFCSLDLHKMVESGTLKGGRYESAVAGQTAACGRLVDRICGDARHGGCFQRKVGPGGTCGSETTFVEAQRLTAVGLHRANAASR